MMSSTRFRRLWLVTCLTLLGGLATVVPVNCLCAADQHWGQAVHPIFQHHHADGHDHTAVGSDSASLAPFGEGAGASVVVSEHGSLMGAAIDGLLQRNAALWLTLGLFPLLTLLPMARHALQCAVVAPPTGPPRLRPLFS